MQNEIKKYTKEKLVCFSIDVKQKKHSNGNYKKNIVFPNKWTDFNINNTKFDEKYNDLALLTGKINNLIIIDIDNIVHWNKLLEENNEEEPDTVKVISGSGGVHFYFRYDKELEEVKSKDHCFGKDYDIDIKTNGGCVIAPPTKYYNENLKKEVEYKWEKSIFEHKPTKMPKWIKSLLLEKKVEKKKIKKNSINNEIEMKKEKNIIENIKENILELQNLEIPEQDFELNFSIKDIESLIDMLEQSRCEKYTNWINVGMCLYNIDPKYLLLWIKWSQQSDKYEEGACEEKWDSFKKDKNGLKIGSLLLWAKNDNYQKYEDFMKKKKISK
jgi:hypothetical protein